MSPKVHLNGTGAGATGQIFPVVEENSPKPVGPACPCGCVDCASVLASKSVSLEGRMATRQLSRNLHPQGRYDHS